MEMLEHWLSTLFGWFSLLGGCVALGLTWAQGTQSPQAKLTLFVCANLSFCGFLLLGRLAEVAAYKRFMAEGKTSDC